MIAWTLFRHPILLNADSWTFWLLLPLCLSVAIIYKTIRIKNLRRLPLEVVALLGYMIAGLAAMGVGLWLVYEFLP